jgi:hypothetical protein
MNLQFRQGDVFLISIDEIPSGAKEMHNPQRVVLAYGESTGHAHALASTMARSFQDKDSLFIKVIAGATLVHEEHAAITLPAGCYRVVRQRQYEEPKPEAVDWSWVED